MVYPRGHTQEKNLLNTHEESEDITTLLNSVTCPSAGHRGRGPVWSPSSKQFASRSQRDRERGQLQLP